MPTTSDLGCRHQSVAELVARLREEDDDALAWPLSARRRQLAGV